MSILNLNPGQEMSQHIAGFIGTETGTMLERQKLWKKVQKNVKR